MASLHFDGASNNLRGTGQGTTLDGAVTIATLLRRTADTAHYEAWFGGATSGNAMSIMLAFDQQSLGVAERITVWDGSTNRYSATTTPTTNTDWWIYAFTRPAGSNPVRWHRKNLTTGSAWLHETESSGPLGASNWPPMNGGYVNVGNYSTAPGNPGALNEGFAGDIALHGWWPVEFSDAEIELLSTGSTSNWYQSPGGVPSSLTELTSVTPADITGRETWALTGATATGAVPPWTFDQKGNQARYFKLTSGPDTTLMATNEQGRPIFWSMSTATPTAVSLGYAEMVRDTWGFMLTEV